MAAKKMLRTMLSRGTHDRHRVTVKRRRLNDKTADWHRNDHDGECQYNEEQWQAPTTQRNYDRLTCRRSPAKFQNSPLESDLQSQDDDVTSSNGAAATVAARKS